MLIVVIYFVFVDAEIALNAAGISRAHAAQRALGHGNGVYLWALTGVIRF